MKETEFNLLDASWIRVMDAECNIREVSLTDALIHAHEYQCLSGELSTQDIAVLRLLLAVLHTVFSRVDADGEECVLEFEDDALDRWESLWKLKQLPEQPIRDYLSQWHERFWLFHPERPFWQVAEMKNGSGFEAKKLNGEISESNNKIRLFSSYSGIEKTNLTYSQAARWLIHLNAYDDNAAKPTKEGKAAAGGKLPSVGVGWLGEISAVYLIGNNLFETLLLNLILINDNVVESKEYPVWEKESVSGHERVEIPLPQNLAELYTLQSRRILLKRTDNNVTGFTLMGGDFFPNINAFVEPMTAWQYPKKDTNDYLPYVLKPEKQLWRDFSSLFISSSERKILLPNIIKWNTLVSAERILPRKYVFRVQTVGIEYCKSQRSSIDNVFADSLAMHADLLSEIGKGWRKDVQTEIERCEELAKAVKKLAQNLYLASGGDKGSGKKQTPSYVRAGDHASAQLYYRLDMPFREWLRQLDPNDIEQKQPQFEQWQQKAKGIALLYGKELIRDVSDTAMTGHMVDKKLYSAPLAYRYFQSDIHKIYHKE